MRVRRTAAVLAAAMALTGAAAVMGTGGPASAMCRIDQDCGPAPEPTITTPPKPTGKIYNYLHTVESCEPRMVPWHTITYDAPDAWATEIWWVNAMDGYVKVARFETAHVSFRRQSYGLYEVRSFDGYGNLLATKTGRTCI